LDGATLASIGHKIGRAGASSSPFGQPVVVERHDLAHHHHRRYSKADLCQVIEGAGLKIELLTHFNTFSSPRRGCADRRQR
jgi:hypothetical protein